MTVGIVCEYNPLHLGHEKQIRQIRREFGPDTRIVCAMSGNFVQRGMPAIVDKSIRSEAAIRCGADLVLELPVTAALSSAEGFAAGGVRVLAPLCDTLCFGSESGDKVSLMATAHALLDSRFPPLLRQELEKGLSFPAARQTALEAMGLGSSLLSLPNDILGVEYCKAILSQGVTMDLFPIRRLGSYHAQETDPENPSATAVRRQMLTGENWEAFVPEAAAELFREASLHTIAAGERAMLAKLRTMTDAEFEALPYGSEGLWRKLMHECRRQNTLEEILTAVKSKRYTRTRLDRMVMCAFLGLTAEDLAIPVPYTRVLAFNDAGRELLRSCKKQAVFRNAGEAAAHPHWALEKTAGDLYSLFSTGETQAPGLEERRRVRYLQKKE